MTILDEILAKIPKDAMINSTSYEGANIVLYTKSKVFFMQGGDIIRRLVEDFKKRIDLRADTVIRADEEKVLAVIKESIPEEAQVTQVLFEPARSVVTIESKKPGLAIGKDGDNLRKIKEETFWTPLVRRESVIPSKITTNIRNVLYADSDGRRKFLDQVGKRIYETKRSSTEEMWARISFLGGARQVGRSCLFLQTPESKVLIDCGVNVAATEKYAFPYLTAPEFNIADLDAVIISHAHLDHSGFLAYLFKMGYRGPVYCTEPVRDVMALLMLDFIEVSHGEGKAPLYSSADVKEAVKHTITLEYGEVTDITPDVRITLYDAGHILGSSLVHIHLGEGWHNVLYTGDFKVKGTRLLNPAHHLFPRVETLIIESTYGAAEDIMPSREDCENELINIVKDTIKRKGKVIIPVLGVGRAQEVMVILEKFSRDEKIDFPIYVDGMVWDVTAVHNAYPRFFNSEVREKIFYEDKDPFLSPIFKQVGSGKERAAVVSGGPCVIVATSGMLTGGPSVSYLKELADNAKNALVFVSYQAEGSPGNKLQKGEKEVLLNGGGDAVKIKLDVHTISGLSGHSDRNELVNYVQIIKPRPRKIIVMHGESSKCLDLASMLHKTFKVETIAPRNLDVIRLK
jgi:hypothetical protein